MLPASLIILYSETDETCCCVHTAAEVRLDALVRESSGALQQLGKGDGGGGHSGSSSSLPGSAERVLKFEIQMYKMRDGEYCIDIQVGMRT